MVNAPIIRVDDCNGVSVEKQGSRRKYTPLNALELSMMLFTQLAYSLFPVLGCPYVYIRTTLCSEETA